MNVVLEPFKKPEDSFNASHVLLTHFQQNLVLQQLPNVASVLLIELPVANVVRLREQAACVNVANSIEITQQISIAGRVQMAQTAIVVMV
jgi:hypothetical protein